MSIQKSLCVRRAALAMTGALLMHRSTAFATLFYSATGYPDQSVTDRRVYEPSGLLSSGYFSDAQPVTISVGTHVNTLNLVCTSDDNNWTDRNLRINFWKATGTQSKEQVFDASPLSGNAINTIARASSSVRWGTSSLGDVPDYYAVLTFTPFDIPAGDYLIGVYLEFPHGSWGFAESGIDRGPGIQAYDSAPNTHFSNFIFGGTTGTDAMDIGGITLIPGDANYDGNVNSADFQILATHFNQSGATWATADFNFDGVTNALDFNTILTHYGQTASAPVAGALAPEPAGLLPAAFALVMTGVRSSRLRGMQGR